MYQRSPRTTKSTVMKKSIFPSILFLSLFTSSLNVLAQKVTFDQVKKQCEGLPQDQRVRLSVSSFKVSAPAAKGKFGEELADQLNAKLQQVDCFNVLLRLTDIGDINAEINLGQSGSTESGSAPDHGKMKGAQVIVIGKVTDYYNPGGYGTTNMVGNAKVGFSISLVNAETREVISTTDINVKGKTFLGVGQNKSLADACEKGITQAVEFIAANKERLPLPAANNNAATTSGKSSKLITSIIVQNADFAKLKPLLDFLATKGTVLEKTMSAGKGSVKFEHTGTVDDLVTALDAKLAAKYSINEFGSGKISLTAK